MAKPEPNLISRERFRNNADLLVFPDRHEYRTRSRARYVFAGVLLFACTLGLLGLPAFPFFGGMSFNDALTWIFEIFVIAVSLFGIYPAICATSHALGFRPQFIIFATGLQFRHWPPRWKIQLHFDEHHAEMYEVQSLSMYWYKIAGSRGNRPGGKIHGVEVNLMDGRVLRLPWATGDEREALRFRDAVENSIRELAARNEGPPYRPS